MSRRIAARIALVTAVLWGFAASAQEPAARGALPGVAAPGSAATAPAVVPQPAAPLAVAPPVGTKSGPTVASAPVISAMARVYIAALQRALPSHGYHPGPQTGRLDRKTAAAIKAYQRDAGLPVDARSEMNLKTTLDSVNFVKPPILAH